MGLLNRAWVALLIGFAVAGFTRATVAADTIAAYVPVAAAPENDAPTWERPKLTRFSAMRCSAGGAFIDQLVINRDEVAQTRGGATYSVAGDDAVRSQGAGGWALTGADLTVTGAGFVLEGRWVGALLTATIVRAGDSQPLRCRFQVAALRAFTHYQ